MGDLYMSIIQTCQLNKVDPFDYLTKVQRNVEAVKAAPAEWLPWTYKETLEAMAGGAAATPASAA